MELRFGAGGPRGSRWHSVPRKGWYKEYGRAPRRRGPTAGQVCAPLLGPKLQKTLGREGLSGLGQGAPGIGT